jgi:hypothetical protein
MRAYTIVIFILAFHAGLAMINVAHLTDVYGFNTTLDTSSKGSFITINGSNNITVPSSTYFNESATGANIYSTERVVNKSDIIGGYIESISGFANTFNKFKDTFFDAIFGIHTLCAPYFGDFNAWVLEGMCDIILAVACFQIITGRSFKTME